MYIKGTFVLALLFAVIMALTSNTHVDARSVEVSQESDVPQDAESPLVRRKRRVFDFSCKGIFDKELYARLDRACLDCQNLYRRELSVDGKCRHNCFGTDVFRSCVKDLRLPVKTYLEIADLLREG